MLRLGRQAKWLREVKFPFAAGANGLAPRVEPFRTVAARFAAGAMAQR